MRMLKPSLAKERWCGILGGVYQVSTFGRVRRVRDQWGNLVYRIIKPQVDKDGYLKFCLSVRGMARGYFGHYLVAKAFIGPRPRGKQVNHRDFNRANNLLRNLEYATPKQNAQHSVRAGRYRNQEGERNPNFKHGNDVVFSMRLDRSLGMTYRELERKYRTKSVHYLLNKRRIQQ